MTLDDPIQMTTLREVAQWTRQAGKRLLITVVGFLLLGAGLVLMVVPIVPGFLVVSADSLCCRPSTSGRSEHLPRDKKGFRRPKRRARTPRTAREKSSKAKIANQVGVLP
jgi:hypothetical protein